MSNPEKRYEKALTQLIGAALAYCAIADWFENSSMEWITKCTEGHAMDIFNKAESELRAAGYRIFNFEKSRKSFLKQAGVPEAAIK